MRAPRLGLSILVLTSFQARAEDLSLEVTGKPTVIYDSLRDACTGIDVPDINTRAFRDASGQLNVFTLHFVNRALRGPDFDHLKIDCHIALDSPLNADPSRYEDRNYIASTWTIDGKAVSALVHHEYHADQHGKCRASGDVACWFNSVLAYQSANGGQTFSKAKPLVVASAPFTQDVDQGRHRGFFNPSNMFADGGYTYVLSSTTGWTGQEPGSCLFRTTNPSDSSLWHAYDGMRFSVRFADPYTSKAQPKPCVTIRPFLFPVGSVTRDRRSGLWIAVFQASQGGLYPVEGFYYSTARDILHWSAPKLLLAGRTAYNDLCKVGPSIINYPAILDPKSPNRNFDTTDADPELFFAIIQVTGCQTAQRLLVRQPLKLTWDSRKQ